VVALERENAAALLCPREQKRRAADGALGFYARRRAGAVLSVVAPDTVFVALSAISGFAVVAVWISICASHFVFRRRHLQSGQPLSALQYRAPWYPLVPVLGFVLCVVACVGLAFDPSQRIALYCGIPLSPCVMVRTT
jgi:amino acid permease